MTLRLHHSPLACSLASRFTLIEAGLDHEVALVRTWLGEHQTEAYGRINPNRKVPALETDDGVLTESTAILPYIAGLAPERALFPAAGFERAQAQAWLSYVSSSVHAAFTGVIAPERFTGDAAGAEAVREGHLARLADTLGKLETHMTGREFILGELSVCDLYLTVFLLWRASPAVGGRLPALPNLDAFQQRMLSRPQLAAAVGEDMRLRAGA